MLDCVAVTFNPKFNYNHQLLVAHLVSTKKYKPCDPMLQLSHCYSHKTPNEGFNRGLRSFCWLSCALSVVNWIDADLAQRAIRPLLFSIFPVIGAVKLQFAWYWDLCGVDQAKCANSNWSGWGLNTNWTRRFWCEDNNADSLGAQCPFFRVVWVTTIRKRGAMGCQ